MISSFKKFVIVFVFVFIGCLGSVDSQVRFSKIIVKGNSLTEGETIKAISGLRANKNFKSQDLNLSALLFLFSKVR